MSTTLTQGRRAGAACSLILVLAAAHVHAGEPPAPHAERAPLAAAYAAGAAAAHRGTLTQLVAEALRNNPEIRAARHEREAASQRIAPAVVHDSIGLVSRCGRSKADA